MAANTTVRKAEAQKQFAELMDDADVTPEKILVAVLAGQQEIKINGKKVKISDQMVQAAKDLVPYRLPRLNSIDADVRNVTETHEQWLKRLDQEAEEKSK